jgi:hypothetical protein
MKTKLKVGDKVFDSALFGDVEGEVISLNEDNPYPIFIAFGHDQENYTIDGCYNKWTNPTLSMQPYDKLSDIIPVWEEEVWGIFWDDPNNPIKLYGQMIKSEDKKFPYRFIENCNNYKNFKETGKLI